MAMVLCYVSASEDNHACNIFVLSAGRGFQNRMPIFPPIIRSSEAQKPELLFSVGYTGSTWWFILPAAMFPGKDNAVALLQVPHRLLESQSRTRSSSAAETLSKKG